MIDLGTIRLSSRAIDKASRIRSYVFKRKTMENSGGFRLALLTASGRCPRWMWEPLQAAVADGRVTLVTVASISGLPTPSHSLIVELYARWERKRYLTPNSLLQDIDVVACSGGPVVSLEAQEVEQLATELANCQADVVLVTPEADQASLDGIGIPVWKIQFGATKRQQNAPGLWEVVERSLSTVSLVETFVTPGSQPRILETIVGGPIHGVGSETKLDWRRKRLSCCDDGFRRRRIVQNASCQVSTAKRSREMVRGRSRELQCWICWLDSANMPASLRSMSDSGNWRLIRRGIFAGSTIQRYLHHL